MACRCSFAFVSLLAVLLPGVGAADVTFTLGAGEDFVVEGAGPVEHLRIDGDTGNVSRSGALFVYTTPQSLSVGFDALAAEAATPADSGDANTAFGHSALQSTSGGCCTYGQPFGGRNSAFGKYALAANVSGNESSAFGANALRNTTVGGSAAFGADALMSSTTGYFNSAFGTRALTANTTGSQNVAFGYGALASNDVGVTNSAVGFAALASNTNGTSNTAVGFQSLAYNTTGDNHVAVGYAALQSTQDSLRNTAVGTRALQFLTTGGDNAAVGMHALRANVVGSNNTAVGSQALDGATGSGNTGVGSSSLGSLGTGNNNVALGGGSSLVTGSDNVYIANTGNNFESGKIRIGTGSQTETFISGISGNTVSGGVPVLINASHELGTTTSSAKFKEKVETLADPRDVLMRLRPVSFVYREDAGGDGATIEYGLIAEEVAKVAPELVVVDGEGAPYSVRYQLLTPMLLREIQRQELAIRDQAKAIDELRAQLADRE